MTTIIVLNETKHQILIKICSIHEHLMCLKVFFYSRINKTQFNLWFAILFN